MNWGGNNTGVHLRFYCQVEPFGFIIYQLYNYFKIHVFPSLKGGSGQDVMVYPVVTLPTSEFHHVQSSRSQVRPLLIKGKLTYVYSILEPHGVSETLTMWF